jgi:hypothetical protein
MPTIAPRPTAIRSAGPIRYPRNNLKYVTRFLHDVRVPSSRSI